MKLNEVILRAIEVSSASSETKEANKLLVKELTTKLSNHLQQIKPRAFQVRFERRGGEYRWVLDTRFKYLRGSKYRGWVRIVPKKQQKVYAARRRAWVVAKPFDGYGWTIRSNRFN